MFADLLQSESMIVLGARFSPGQLVRENISFHLIKEWIRAHSPALFPKLDNWVNAFIMASGDVRTSITVMSEKVGVLAC